MLSVDQSRNTSDPVAAQVGTPNGSSIFDMNSNAEVFSSAHDGAGDTSGYGGNPISSMFSNQMQHEHRKLQQHQSNQFDSQVNMNNSLDINNEIKRLQHLHQISVSNSSNALLINPGSAPDASTTTFLHLLDSQQRVNPNRFDSSLPNSISSNTGGPYINLDGAAGSVSNSNTGIDTLNNSNNGGLLNPLQLPKNFFADARLLFAQSHFQHQGAVAVNFSDLRNQLVQQQLTQGGSNAELPLPSPHSLFHRDGSRRMRGGVIEPFPEKLHRLLTEAESAGRSDVISFVVSGRAFLIHNPDKFFKDIIPLYFRQSRLSSFKRQLNLYGFELINTGPARGGYYHELFVKDQPELCRRMRRVAVKPAPKDNTSVDASEEDKVEKSLGLDLD